jgi:hypothetical protein
MNVYIIIGITILISAVLYFLFFFKGGVKRYFNKTLVAIDAHKKQSLTTTPTPLKRTRLPMLIRGKLIKTSTEEDITLDYGEEANGLLNDMLDNISNKLCDKKSTKKFPMKDSSFNKILFSLLKDIYNSNKFTTEEKEDYLAVLSLLGDDTNFSVVNNSVKITKDTDKKLVKSFMPSLDITGDLLLTFDQFKTINFNVSAALFDPEKFVKITKIMNNYDSSVDLPVELFDLLIFQQIISGTKLSDEEKSRINIYIFGEQEPDYNLFKNDINGNILNKLFIKLNGTNEDYDKKMKILINAAILLSINNMLVEDKIIPIIQSIEGSIPDETISEIKDQIMNSISLFKGFLTMPPICELI